MPSWSVGILYVYNIDKPFKLIEQTPKDDYRLNNTSVIPLQNVLLFVVILSYI